LLFSAPDCREQSIATQHLVVSLLYLQTGFPIDSSNLRRWRKRIGEQGVQTLLMAPINAVRGAGSSDEVRDFCAGLPCETSRRDGKYAPYVFCC